MEIHFNEWHCFDISSQQKKELEDDIKKAVTRSINSKICVSKKLTLHTFAIPASRSLLCSGVDENNTELIRFTHPIPRTFSKSDFLKRDESFLLSALEQHNIQQDRSVRPQ